MVWKLVAPHAPLYIGISSDRFAYYIQPKELNANPTLAEATCIGTGYKVLDKHQPSISMEYRKHADYWGGEPFIDRWNATIIPEYSNRYAQFLAGNIIDFPPTARDVLLLHKDAPQAVIVAEEIDNENRTQAQFGANNPQSFPWKDPRVRIALRRSINFKGIGEFLSNKAELEASGISPELLPMTHINRDPSVWLNPEQGELGALSANYLYDVAEAKKMLAAAGHTAPIDLPYYLDQSTGAVPDEEQLVIDSLNLAGTFKLQINGVRNANEYRDYRNTLKFDGLVTQVGATADVDYHINRVYHSAGNLPRGVPAYPDPRIDALATAQRRELDFEKRRQMIKDFQMLVAELFPTIPGRHSYTTFNFRWPWLHNSAYGSAGSPPEGQPVAGGHLHWLSSDMPNRDKAI
jgi:ABC-type transport system substrate-binding protein